MLLRNCALMVCSLTATQSAMALTIDAINVSTIMGTVDSHTPNSPYDRFSILGAAYTYTLSDGQVRRFGAGSIPYTRGHLANVTVANGAVSYAFDQVSN
jgi:hypothetical protein